MQVGQVSTPTANVTQALQKTTDTQKLDDVAALLLEEARQAESSGQPMPLTIIFVERKARCDDVAELLRTEGLSALALHGGLSQWEREGALRDFTKGDVRVRSQRWKHPLLHCALRLSVMQYLESITYCLHTCVLRCLSAGLLPCYCQPLIHNIVVGCSPPLVGLGSWSHCMLRPLPC